MTSQAVPVRARRSGYAAYLIPGLVAFAVVVLVPTVANTWLSLTRWSGIGAPVFVGLDNYAELFSDAMFWRSFSNSIAVILAMAVVPTTFGLVIAAVLHDYVAPRFGGVTSAAMRALIYIPQIIPIAVAGVLWNFILQPQTGLLNNSLRTLGLGDLASNWLGDPALALPTLMVILVWLQLGYTLVVFMSGLSRVDPSLHEAASLDGAGWWRRFLDVTVIALRPEIAVVLLTTIVAGLKVFAPIFVLTSGGPGDATIVPSYFAFYHFFTTMKVGYGAAVANILGVILTVLAITLLAVQTRRSQS